jgi:glycine cleavage system H protein
MNPDDLMYTKDHEWLQIDDDIATIGISHHAQEELGDVVYVELPSVGDSVESGESFGTVESVKAVSELFTPVSGEVVRVNETLGDSPELVNNDPYGKGWMIAVRVSQAPDETDLMSHDEYRDFVASSED